MIRIALLIIPIALVSGCCGYGGPGCSEPAIVGLCAAQVPIGRSVVTLNFGDDTGYHPSEYGRVSAGPGDLLSAEIGCQTGELILVGLSPGQSLFRVGAVEGWDESVEFQYSVKVVAEVVENACESDDRVLLPDPSMR